MSETNLLRAKYALDLRNLRLSTDRREELNVANFSVSSKGLVDITEHSKLNAFSAFLQEGRSDEEKVTFSAGNINLYALNNRVRLRMMEIFSNLLEINLFERVKSAWSELDEEGLKITGSLFSAIFFEKDETPDIDELLRFWFSYNNPAHSRYSREFYGQDKDLDNLFDQISKAIFDIKENLPQIDEGEILAYLRAPETHHPHSIKDQIQYIIDNWSKYLSQENLKFLLLAMDLIKEEEKFRGFGGPGPAEIYEFGGSSLASFYGEADYERFSMDKDWMPSLVLLAKNIHVWLDQLSKKYGRSITTLNDIPDEELDLLAHRGITGLWLVGVWERSAASKKIKNMTGNEAAISSAYSIHDYVIADDLGGRVEYDKLKGRLIQRGIRIGADMVPNHMGIYSKWTVEHPDWFIHSKEKPFPSYQYTGEDLSEDPDIEIYLEDHYFDQSDAAVAFKRVDSNTGDVHYIYHGNDGTSFPWNDTAQIDFLNQDAREAVIDKIVNVAKEFPIIRFDAAMVLAKQHIRRLWYPAPGEGGDIPSRSQYSMSDEEFNKRIPKEFWREVVDRVNEEAPDTLLLAEAFWLLEGYFVRTLGMHRVYNSAFMKMLRDEDNAKYRQTIKNVLEYDPEILKRFVNYLTTPDEEPAISQFGTGDKYFGLATMMVTMPGLPMFGHGQFEGLKEKYGMEYNQAHYNESINHELVDRHEFEIVPLLTKRYLFAGSENFYLYDFFNADGTVNEDVFAYSNRYRGEKAIVIYNNRYAQASGWVKRSVAFAEKLDDKTTALKQVDLFEGLDLADGDGFVLFRDHVTGLEYIRSKDEIREQGLFVKVGAFKYHVFVDLKEVYDNQGIWSEVAKKLNGEGVDNLQSMFDDLQQSYGEPKISTSVDEKSKEGEESLAQLKVRLNEVKDENVALKGQIAAMSAQLEENSELHQKLKALQKENKELITKIENLPADKLSKDVSKQVAKLQTDIKVKENEITTLEKENEELSSSIENMKSSKVTLESDITDLEGEIKSLKMKLQKAKSDTSDDLEIDKLQEKVITKDRKIEALQKEVKLLTTRNQELSKQIEEGGTGKGQETLLSSVLLENIMNELEASKSGIKLRNLAMSLGISASVCLDHVRTMEDQNRVDISYKSTDDSNPMIIPKKV